MPNYKIQLIGPDTKYGAWKDKALKRYIWHVVWYEGRSRRRASLGVEKGRDYSDAFSEFLQSRYETPRESKLVAHVISRYFSDVGKHARDIKGNARRCKVLINFFGKCTADEISEPLCRAFASTRKTQGTARLELGTLKTALNYAARVGMIPVSPPVWKPKEPPGRDRVLSESDVDAILGDMNTPSSLHFQLAIRISYLTAARIESVLALEWSESRDGGHVDLERGIIQLNPTGREVTRKRKPTIPIPASLKPHLEAARARTTRWVCEGQRGVRPSYQTMIKRWVKACKNCDITGATLHSLCHTRITMLLEAGQSVALVSRFTGRSVEMLMNRYGHLTVEGGIRKIADDL